MQQIRGRRVTVMGLGRFGGGIGVSQWLASNGAIVTVTDKDPADKLADSVKKLASLPITFRLGEHREEDFTRADLVVASPAVPPTSPYLQAAMRAGVPVTTEIRLFVERCPGTVVGVTGTKGKSTTTALLGEMLKTRYTTWVGGNIGRSLLLELPNMQKTDLVVLELSSYMLEHLRAAAWSPHVAVMTMIAPDHLEWHGSYEAYVDAKRNILRFQRPDDHAVLNCANAACRAMASATAGHVHEFGAEGRAPFELAVPGAHNQLNAQAAFAAAAVLGVSRDDAQRAVRDVRGLAHRLELVHESPEGVRWVNDSIATIPEAAVAALESFPPRRVLQIVGGHDKHLDMAPLTRALAERAKAVLCIGQLGPSIGEAVDARRAGALPIVRTCGELAPAVAAARELAERGDIVLLSTGCASYDQFANFEQRGQAFTRLARGAADDVPQDQVLPPLASSRRNLP